METNLEWVYNEQYTVCYECILVPTNNMIAFTFFQSKITLFSALFQKYYSEADVAFVELTLNSFGTMWYDRGDSLEKV